MDPRTNPYAPGAGTPPPELAGRDEIVERADIAIHRIKKKLSARSLIFYGLRGVGKTVLLNHVRREAEAKGVVGVWIEAQEDRSLPAVLAPQLRAALLRLSRFDKLKMGAERALRALAGLVNSVKIKYGDIEIGADFLPEPGLERFPV